MGRDPRKGADIYDLGLGGGSFASPQKTVGRRKVVLFFLGRRLTGMKEPEPLCRGRGWPQPELGTEGRLCLCSAGTARWGSCALERGGQGQHLWPKDHLAEDTTPTAANGHVPSPES